MICPTYDQWKTTPPDERDEQDNRDSDRAEQQDEQDRLMGRDIEDEKRHQKDGDDWVPRPSNRPSDDPDGADDES